jgi:hypothetical protein
MSVPRVGSVGQKAIRAAVGRVLRAGQFYVGAKRLRIEHIECQQAAWEIFRGHLLDPAHTRHTASFEAWNVFLDDQSTALTPLISILWQTDARLIHVVRRILTHGFEAYEDSPGVILSRPAHKWVAELVGTIELEQFPPATLECELATYVFLAIIGTSRLPITPLESPLPAFSLGQFAFVPNVPEADDAWNDPTDFLRNALDGNLSSIEQAKALETALRAEPLDRLPQLVRILQESSLRRSGEPDWLARLFRTVFNTAALSPYTGFADRMIGVLLHLAEADGPGAASVIDVVGYMLRQLCRHLTAFDLTLFHNFGANYPDALFLDSLLAAYLQLIERHEALFQDNGSDSAPLARRKRLRRRALRQACLARKQYEGHRVPDAPTSMGENARVLPAPLERVPEEQILQAAKRRRTLFDGAPTEGLLDATPRRAFDDSLADLRHSDELCELGMAHFLDRPLGMFKAPGEVDRTPLLSYEAFSRSIAKRRLAQLKSWGWLPSDLHEQRVAALDGWSMSGLAATQVAPVERAGVASLADMRKVATDFLLLRATRSSLDELLAHYDLRELMAAAPEIGNWLSADRQVLLVPHAAPDAPLAQATLRAYDRSYALVLELGFETTPDGTVRYRERGGVELVERLQVKGVEQSTWIDLHTLRK